MKRKVKQYEDEPEAAEPLIGSHSSFTEVPSDDTPSDKPQIGFIRQNKGEKKKKWEKHSKKSKTK